MSDTEKMPDDGRLEEQFMDVLENKRIKTVFQPVVSLRDGSVFGYEALSRGPSDSALQSPKTLFDCAEKYGKLWELELLCRVTAIETAFRLNTPLKLFLNVNPQVIHDVKFQQGFTKQFLKQYNMDPENIVFEITEKGLIKNTSDFICTIDNYKKQFYKIAIDDAGAGYSGLNLITDIHPHYIKLDMNLIRDIDKDVLRQALIRSFAEFATLTNTVLIAEGIETKSELLKLIDIGVHYGQGYYLQRPDPIILPLGAEVLYSIKEANRKKNHLLDRKPSDLYVSNISTPQRTIHPKILISQVFESMEKDPSLSGVCVTEEETIIGVITRAELYRRLSGKYGYSLYSRKPAEKIMSKEFLQVDCHESIETVSKKAMGREYEHLYDFIAVTREGKYHGIVTVKDLLEKTIQIEVNNAKHLNPLSELPGNVMIEKKLEECVGSSARCHIIYFDIDNFKAYNDVYGFENGDKFIRCFTQILRTNISEERDFIGHIGGDDFIAVVNGNHVEEICRSIIEQFDRSVFQYYNKNDLTKGYITTKNRHGIEEDFPLLSISVVVVPGNRYNTAYELSQKMSELKKICKQKPGSNCMLV